MRRKEEPADNLILPQNARDKTGSDISDHLGAPTFHLF